MDAAQSLSRYGTTQPVAPARRLRAGALSCEFAQGALRDVRWGDVEVVRSIAYLLRDRDWGTASAECEDLVVDESQLHFRVRFELRITTLAGTLKALAHIEGHADGRLLFEVRATPDVAISTNRCGFVVLHPASAAGRALRVEHADGRRSDGRFPREISPSQVVSNIRSLAYDPADSVELRLTLEAELPADGSGAFEMEDQRNWSDASFKTYVGSLLDPWPYELQANTTLAQRVGLRVSGPVASANSSEGPPPAIVIGGATGARMPAIGVGIPPGFALACARERAALAGLGAGWWVVETALDDPRHGADLVAVAALRREVDVQVRLDVIVPDRLSPEAGAAIAAAACEQAGLRIDALRMLPRSYLKSFQPTDRWPDLPPLESYAQAARARFPAARIGGGMFTCFTELNRKRQSPAGLDFIGHATFPIVHAADDLAVMQTFESLPHIVHSVRSAWPGTAYHLGPSTIAMRRNPYGDRPAANPGNERVAMADADPRHDALFGAAWTAAYVAAVAPLGLDMLALHASHGASGPLGHRTGSMSPMPAAVVPAWAMLRRFAVASGSAVVALKDMPNQTAGIAWRRPDGGTEGVVVNLGNESRTVRWDAPVRTDGAVASTWELAPFDARCFERDSLMSRAATSA